MIGQEETNPPLLYTKHLLTDSHFKKQLKKNQ